MNLKRNGAAAPAKIGGNEVGPRRGDIAGFFEAAQLTSLTWPEALERNGLNARGRAYVQSVLAANPGLGNVKAAYWPNLSPEAMAPIDDLALVAMANDSGDSARKAVRPFPLHAIETQEQLEARFKNHPAKSGKKSDIRPFPSNAIGRFPEAQSQATEENRNQGEQERIDGLYEKYQILRPKPLVAASRTLPPELISGVLYQGRRMLLTGGSKGGKSWLLHQIAYCLSNGLSLFNRFATKPTPVFYVNFELMEAGSALRFDAIKEALGKGSQADITIISVSDYLDVVGNDFPEYLALLARDNGAGTVIIDPMWRLLGEREENSNTAIGQLLKPLVRFSREAHASMIGAHHHAKGNANAKEAIDQASGAGAFIRDPATVLVMSAHKEDDAYIVTLRTNDFAPVDKFVIRFEYPLFLIDEALDPAEVREAPHVSRAKRKSESQAGQILTAIRTRESPDQEAGLAHAEIVRATRILKGTVTKILKRLIRDKMVYKSVAGSEERYALTAWFRAKMDAEALEANENGEEL